MDAAAEPERGKRSKSDLRTGISYIYRRKCTDPLGRCFESASDAVAGLLKQSQTKTGEQTESVSLDQIPEYSDSPYVEINGNVPSFSDEKAQDLHTNFTVNWILWDAAVMQNPRSHRS